MAGLDTLHGGADDAGQQGEGHVLIHHVEHGAAVVRLHHQGEGAHLVHVAEAIAVEAEQVAAVVENLPGQQGGAGLGAFQPFQYVQHPLAEGLGARGAGQHGDQVAAARAEDRYQFL